MNNGMAITLLVLMVLMMAFLSTIEDEVTYEEDERADIYREKGFHGQSFYRNCVNYCNNGGV